MCSCDHAICVSFGVVDFSDTRQFTVTICFTWDLGEIYGLPAFEFRVVEAVLGCGSDVSPNSRQGFGDFLPVSGVGSPGAGGGGLGGESSESTWR